MAKWAYLWCWCTCILHAKPGGREAPGKSQKRFASSCGPSWRAVQLLREGAESPQTLDLAGHPVQLGLMGLSMVFWPLYANLSKDPPISGLSIRICPLHTWACVTIHCLGNTFWIETLDLPIFLSCFLSFIQALCQQSQLPETNPVNLSGKTPCAGTSAPAPSVFTLSWPCSPRPVMLGPLLLHGSLQPPPRLWTFPIPAALASRAPSKETPVLLSLM